MLCRSSNLIWATVTSLKHRRRRPSTNHRGNAMAETKQLNFDLKEVAAALIKEEGIREGRWMLGFEFGFGAGNFATGPTASDTKPGAFAQIKAVMLVRQEEGAPDLPFVIDAAEVHERSPG